MVSGARLYHLPGKYETGRAGAKCFVVTELAPRRSGERYTLRVNGYFPDPAADPTEKVKASDIVEVSIRDLHGDYDKLHREYLAFHAERALRREIRLEIEASRMAQINSVVEILRQSGVEATVLTRYGIKVGDDWTANEYQVVINREGAARVGVLVGYAASYEQAMMFA
jgi:hypothetical protein